VWRLVKPDFPFKGTWELIANYGFPKTKTSIQLNHISDIDQFLWAHIWYAFKIGLVNHSTVVEKAISQVQNGDKNIAILKLAGLYPDKDHQEIEAVLTQLAYIGADLGICRIKNDWAIFTCCNWLQSGANFSKISRDIDQLYSDLDYLEILEPFVSYMPSPDGTVGNIEKGLKKFCKSSKCA